MSALEDAFRDLMGALEHWSRRRGDSDPEPVLAAYADFKAAYQPEPRPLTWGTVPMGWEVQAPDGKWYRLDGTRYSEHTGMQMVTMLGKEWSRLPRDPVTARPAHPDAVDAAIAAFGFPEILEDGS